MRTINIHEAKTHLSRLVEEVVRGEPFVIAKAGRPLVKVIPLGAPEQAAMRRIGFLSGPFRVPDDFDTMAEDEIASMFEGDR